MRSAFRSLLAFVAICIALGTFPPGLSTASACPNCKNANETNERRPKAYMYSILFMIGMPAMIFTGFSLGFYRMTRRAQVENDQAADSETA